MRRIGVFLLLATAALGCTPTPKREMRQPTSEELISPPPDKYTGPREVPRDEPVLMPKTNTAPNLNSINGAGGPSAGGPGGAGMPVGNTRR